MEEDNFDNISSTQQEEVYDWEDLPVERNDWVDVPTTIGRAAAQGASLSWGDELSPIIERAVAKVLMPKETYDNVYGPKSYEELRNIYRQENEEARKAHPYIYGGTQLATSTPALIATAGKATSLPAITGISAAQGGTFAAGESEREGSDLLMDTALGIGIGAGTTVLGAKLAPLLGKGPKKPLTRMERAKEVLERPTNLDELTKEYQVPLDLSEPVPTVAPTPKAQPISPEKVVAQLRPKSSDEIMQSLVANDTEFTNTKRALLDKLSKELDAEYPNVMRGDKTKYLALEAEQKRVKEMLPPTVYRGISRAELKSIMKTGKIESRKIGNISPEEGTLFADTPNKARGYGTDFTMKGWKPRENRPGYVIEVKSNPNMKYQDPIYPLGNIDSKTSVPKEHIVSIYEITPKPKVQWSDEIAKEYKTVPTDPKDWVYKEVTEEFIPKTTKEVVTPGATETLPTPTTKKD